MPKQFTTKEKFLQSLLNPVMDSYDYVEEEEEHEISMTPQELEQLQEFASIIQSGVFQEIDNYDFFMNFLV